MLLIFSTSIIESDGSLISPVLIILISVQKPPVSLSMSWSNKSREEYADKSSVSQKLKSLGVPASGDGKAVIDTVVDLGGQEPTAGTVYVKL